MIAPALAPEPRVDPDEQAVTDWLKLRLADLKERSGIEAIDLTVIHYPHSGEIEAYWTLHTGGQCVVSQPSIAEGVRALQVKLATLGPNGTQQP